MTWGFVRLGLFTGAFLIGMLLSHSGLLYPSDSAPVLNEKAGASLVVACDNAPVVVEPLKPNHNAVQLHCEESRMVVVRDHPPVKDGPAFNRMKFHVDRGL
jgi:hypothetical protein